MKKFLILLIIIALGLACLNVFEFLNMQKISNEYQLSQDNYHELLNEEVNKKDELTSTEEELETLKEENRNNNQELKVWTNLIETVQDLLK